MVRTVFCYRMTSVAETIRLTGRGKYSEDANRYGRICVYRPRSITLKADAPARESDNRSGYVGKDCKSLPAQRSSSAASHRRLAGPFNSVPAAAP